VFFSSLLRPRAQFDGELQGDVRTRLPVPDVLFGKYLSQFLGLAALSQEFRNAESITSIAQIERTGPAQDTISFLLTESHRQKTDRFQLLQLDPEFQNLFHGFLTSKTSVSGLKEIGRGLYVATPKEAGRS